MAAPIMSPEGTYWRIYRSASSEFPPSRQGGGRALPKARALMLQEESHIWTRSQAAGSLLLKSVVFQGLRNDMEVQRNPIGVDGFQVRFWTLHADEGSLVTFTFAHVEANMTLRCSTRPSATCAHRKLHSIHAFIASEFRLPVCATPEQA